MWAQDYHHRFAIPCAVFCIVPRKGSDPMPDAVMLILIVLAVLVPVAYAEFCRVI